MWQLQPNLSPWRIMQRKTRVRNSWVGWFWPHSDNDSSGSTLFGFRESLVSWVLAKRESVSSRLLPLLLQQPESCDTLPCATSPPKQGSWDKYISHLWRSDIPGTGCSPRLGICCWLSFRITVYCMPVLGSTGGEGRREGKKNTHDQKERVMPHLGKRYLQHEEMVFSHHMAHLVYLSRKMQWKGREKSPLSSSV